MRAAARRALMLIASLALAAAAGATGVRIDTAEHLFDLAHPDELRCMSDGAVVLAAGGEVFRSADGKAPFAPATGLALPAPRGRLLLLATAGHAPPVGVRQIESCGDRYFALARDGVFTGPRSGVAEPVRVDLPAFAPGNALDGALVTDGRLHVFGPRGLYRREAGGGWSTLTADSVRGAVATSAGVVALTREYVRRFPGTDPALPAPRDAWAIAADAEGQPLVATADAVRGAGAPLPLSAAPQVLYTYGDNLAVALTGEEGGLLLARRGPGGSLEVRRFDVAARCFLAEPSRLLVGTDDGLASIEDDRVHWYFARARMGVTAIARCGSLLVIATTEGVLALDGPAIVGHHPLGETGGEARVTALAAEGDDVWAATLGHGLYRLRLTREGAR